MDDGNHTPRRLRKEVNGVPETPYKSPVALTPRMSLHSPVTHPQQWNWGGQEDVSVTLPAPTTHTDDTCWPTCPPPMRTHTPPPSWVPTVRPAVTGFPLTPAPNYGNPYKGPNVARPLFSPDGDDMPQPSPIVTPPLKYASYPALTVPAINANPFSPYRQRNTLKVPQSSLLVDIITSNQDSHVPSSASCSVDARNCVTLLPPNSMDVDSDDESCDNHSIVSYSTALPISEPPRASTVFQTEFRTPWGDVQSIPVHQDVNGTVWLVRSGLDGQAYFLKEVPCENSLQVSTTLQSELKALHLAEDCDNITTLHAMWMCRSKTMCYLLLECSAGGTLPQFLARKGKSEEIVSDVLQQVLQGLVTLHQARLVHGNCHVYNCFVNPNLLSCDTEVGSIIKIGNFGLARATTADASIGPSADVLRFGTTLRECLGESTIATYSPSLRRTLDRMTDPHRPCNASDALKEMGVCQSFTCRELKKAYELEMARQRVVSIPSRQDESRPFSPPQTPYGSVWGETENVLTNAARMFPTGIPIVARSKSCHFGRRSQASSTY